MSFGRGVAPVYINGKFYHFHFISFFNLVRVLLPIDVNYIILPVNAIFHITLDHYPGIVLIS